MAQKKRENLQENEKMKTLSESLIKSGLSTSKDIKSAEFSENPEILEHYKRERLQKVIDDLKENDPDFKQAHLAKILGYSPGGLSAIISGKRGISNDLAAKINKLYPQYSLEWLLGLDFYANEKEKNTGNSEAYPLQDEWTLDFIKAVSGVDLRQVQVFSTDDPADNVTVRTIKGKNCILSEDEVKSFLDEVRAFVKFKIDYLSKTSREPSAEYSPGQAFFYTS